MQDELKTKAQLIQELNGLRLRLSLAESRPGGKSVASCTGAGSPGEEEEALLRGTVESCVQECRGQEALATAPPRANSLMPAQTEFIRLAQLLLDTLPHPTMLIDKDCLILAANETARKMGARVGGLCWREFSHSLYIPANDRKYMEQHGGSPPPGGTRCSFCRAEEALTDETSKNIREIHTLGRTWHVWWVPIDANMFLHYGIDISDFKRSEEKLKASEARFRELFNRMRNGAAVFDVLPGGSGLVFRNLNRAAEKIAGLPRELILGRSPVEVFSNVKSLDVMEILLRVWTTGKPEHHPIIFRDRNQQDRWLESYTFRLPSGQIVAIFDDISDRKRAEDALRYSEARYRAVVEDQTELISRFSEDGTITFVNEAYCRYFQESREDLVGNKFWYHLPKSDHTKLKKHIARLTPEKPVAVIEHRIVGPTGKIHWLRWTDRAIFDEQSRLVEYQGVGLDITHAKHAEMLSKLRAERIDLLNRIIGWGNRAPHLNALLEKFLEFTLRLMHFEGGAICLARDAGRPIELLHQKGLPEAFQEELQGHRCQAQLEAVRFRRQRPLFWEDCSTLFPVLSDRWGFKSCAMIPLFSNSRYIGTLYLFSKKKRTFTPEEKKTFQTIGRKMGSGIAKMQAEEALRQSEKKLRSLSNQLLNAQERERSRISRELHDELGQALMVLKLQLKLVEKQLRQDQQSLRSGCQSSIRSVDEIIEKVRRLSRDLSPSILEDLGLSAALRWLFDDFSKRLHVQCVLEMIPFKESFSKEMKIAIYRIFQESLTNIAKHAHASTVWITIAEKDGCFLCTIEDNGQGFDLDNHLQKRATERGMGLSAMDERARMLGGSLDIWSKEGKGSRIILRIPLDRKGDGS